MPTPPEVAVIQLLSSTSMASGFGSPSQGIERTRVLRWQVEVFTTAPPSHDDTMEQKLHRFLELKLGKDSFKMTKLRTKE